MNGLVIIKNHTHMHPIGNIKHFFGLRMACYHGGNRQEAIDSAGSPGGARDRGPVPATRAPPTDPLAQNAPGVF